KKYQDGLPRVPTMIGMDSFNEVVSSFKGITPTDEKELIGVLGSQDKTSKARTIASVSEAEKTQGKIIFITTKANRLPASVGPSAMDYYLKTKTIKNKKKPAPQKVVESAPIRIYGQKNGQRSIASVKPLEVERSIASERERLLDDINAAFVMSLNDEAGTQRRHSPERLNLIQELESVSKPFLKNN